jgi:anti-sigma B factor antagonist
MIPGNGRPDWTPELDALPEEQLDLRVGGHGDGRAEVTVAGEIDFATHETLLNTLMEEIEHGHRRIVLDMSGVTFCDSTGLGVLIRVQQRAVAAGGWLRVAGASETVRRALEITNLDRLIPAYRTVAEAATAP